MKFLRLALVSTAIALGLLMPRPVSAQSNVICDGTVADNFPTYTSGWRIIEGSIQQYLGYPNVLGSNGHSIVNPLQTRVAAYIEFSDPVQIYSIRGAFFSGRITIGGHLFTTFEATTSDGIRGNSISNGFGWHDTTTYLAQNHATRLTLSVTRTGDEAVALTITEICYGTATSPDTTGTPTPSRTPTISPTPTATVPAGSPPPPTYTPSPTATATSPVATNTPGGPTNTPGGSTPDLTLTGTPRGIAPPQKMDPCSDDIDCGKPLIVPGFAVIDLPSPTAMTQVAFAPTSTLYSLPGTGTPGATNTTVPIGNDILSYATKIADVGNAVGEGSEGGASYGIQSGHGFAVDIQNGGNEIGSYVGVLFGAARAIQIFFLGKTGTIIAFLLLLVGFQLVLRLMLWLVSTVKTLFMFFLDVVSKVREFFSI